jgi:predicted SprT family Zn-dependent metalloprotease
MWCSRREGQDSWGIIHTIRLQRYKITYQIKALDKYDEEINLQTVPHEIAHFVCKVKKIGKNHDKGWKEVCVKLGGDGKTCAPPPKKKPSVIRTCGKKCDLLDAFAFVKHKYLKGIK